MEILPKDQSAVGKPLFFLGIRHIYVGMLLFLHG